MCSICARTKSRKQEKAKRIQNSPRGAKQEQSDCLFFALYLFYWWIDPEHQLEGNIYDKRVNNARVQLHA